MSKAPALAKNSVEEELSVTVGLVMVLRLEFVREELLTGVTVEHLDTSGELDCCSDTGKNSDSLCTATISSVKGLALYLVTLSLLSFFPANPDRPN